VLVPRQRSLPGSGRLRGEYTRGSYAPATGFNQWDMT